jgi:hypothetical protein
MHALSGQFGYFNLEFHFTGNTSKINIPDPHLFNEDPDPVRIGMRI